MSLWISVEKQLPAPRQKVSVCSEDLPTREAIYIRRGKKRGYWRPINANPIHRKMLHGITHWMP